MKIWGRLLMGSLLLGLLTAGCGGTSTVPQPRSVIVFSGERIQPDPDRMAQADSHLRTQLEDIEANPSFLIRLERQDDAVYPWDTLEMEGDTATIFLERAAVDAQTPYLVYAHLHLMDQRGELLEWLPFRDDPVEGLDAEEAILEWVAEVWLLGRSVFDTQAHGPLDELTYANERGFLRPFILATQAERFSDERAAFTEENPDWEEELTDFFQRTFERDGPGYRPSAEGADLE